MRTLYNEASQSQRDVEIGELDELMDEKGVWKQKISVKSKYKAGQFECKPLLRDEEINDLVKRLKRIKGFEWTYANAVVKEPLFKQVKNFVTTEKGVLRFSLQTTNSRKIRKAILDFIEKYGPRKGRVIGVDDDGEEDVISLNVKPQVFAEYDFDTLVTSDFVDLSNLEESPALLQLMEIAEANKRLLQG